MLEQNFSSFYLKKVPIFVINTKIGSVKKNYLNKMIWTFLVQSEGYNEVVKIEFEVFSQHINHEKIHNWWKTNLTKISRKKQKIKVKKTQSKGRNRN